jgi:hypothetical protein
MEMSVLVFSRCHMLQVSVENMNIYDMIFFPSFFFNESYYIRYENPQNVLDMP